MYKILTLLILINLCWSISFEAYSQHRKTRREKSEPDFETAGEQEIYWAKEIFKNDYKTVHYKKFEGSVGKVDPLTFKFDTVTFKLIEEQPVFSLILENRLLNPSTLGSSLHDFEEPEYLKTSPQVKRFKIVVGVWFNGGIKLANPIVYFFELTNKKATKDTDIKTFIEGAELTFLKQGWVMI
jgi:hypothetical protein